VVQFDLETPAWMKSVKECAALGLEPLADLWDFVSHWFDRAEVKIRRLMAQPKYVLRCWVEANQNTIVDYYDAEGYVRAFHPTDQLKIAKDLQTFKDWPDCCPVMIVQEAAYVQ